MTRSALGLLSSPLIPECTESAPQTHKALALVPAGHALALLRKVYKIPRITVYITNIFLNIKFSLNDFKIHNFKERKQLPKCFRQNLHGGKSQSVSEKSHWLFFFNISQNFPITANPV